MKTISTYLPNVFTIEYDKFEDERGSFVKTMSSFLMFELKPIKESFYSISKKNVLRGMHFQKYPHNYDRYVHVIEGEILDVVVGLENENKGVYFSTILSSEECNGIYASGNYAHGFLTLSDRAIVQYFTTANYNKDCDTGILYNSFNYPWDEFVEEKNLIISERDLSFKRLEEL